jgi:hypothetical protein
MEELYYHQLFLLSQRFNWQSRAKDEAGGGGEEKKVIV